MRCPGPPCRHDGQYCWQDPLGKKHYKLKTHHLRSLVKFVENGGELETHEDVPDDIRQQLYGEEEQRLEKQKKGGQNAQGGTMWPPININVLPSQSSHPSQMYSNASPSVTCGPIDIPGPLDTAIDEYTAWQKSRVSRDSFKEQMDIARNVALENCLDLRQIHKDQDSGFFVSQGVKVGAARRFVTLSLTQTPTQVGTRQRVSALRKACLVRDHHRCVISRKFDIVEARKRSAEDRDNCKDDDGNLLSSEARGGFQYLEVAHILPHSLTTVAQGESELSESKTNVFRILDMFDPGLSHRLDGANIDRPVNALTLTLEYHRLFGEFQIYFEPTGRPHEYKIESLEDSPFLRDPLFPVTRTLSLSPNRTIDPPDSRLLRVHCAIAHIMKLSGAAEHIESVLRDMEEVDVKADGSTNLGYMMGLRLNGWVNTLSVF
ncbi:hypothetical protein CBS147353_11647 [Aspergillus niger]|nr:hypothetical protein CBS147353_11647 [Aspergillus niger]